MVETKRILVGFLFIVVVGDKDVNLRLLLCIVPVYITVCKLKTL